MAHCIALRILIANYYSSGVVDCWFFKTCWFHSFLFLYLFFSRHPTSAPLSHPAHLFFASITTSFSSPSLSSFLVLPFPFLLLFFLFCRRHQIASSSSSAFDHDGYGQHSMFSQARTDSFSSMDGAFETVGGSQSAPKFVKDTSCFWYKPKISREEGEGRSIILVDEALCSFSCGLH